VSSPNEHEESPPCEYIGVYEKGAIRLTAGVDWPEGTTVIVRAADFKPNGDISRFKKVIIAGFGLSGRAVATICERYGIDYVIIEWNAKTVQTQRDLGRQVIEGNIAAEETLRKAGIEDASVLALTVPDDASIKKATHIAKAINPDLYIIGRAVYASVGMQIEKAGADDVIKVEQVVAREFYELLLRKLTCSQPDAQPAVAETAPPTRG
jgi:D-arabinose 1-dehydrogenase-like Zn-dependent alcohol dehydrogenase